MAVGDFKAAANAASVKLNCGRPTEVWEEYVAGLDPTNANSQLKAMIEMQGDTPIVTWNPNLNTNGVVRTYKGLWQRDAGKRRRVAVSDQLAPQVLQGNGRDAVEGYVTLAG